MARYKFTAYQNDRQPRYIVVWDLQWRVIEYYRLDAACDLNGAMGDTLLRLNEDGWRAEGSHQYGFVFLRRERERRLVMLTARHPMDRTPQSFSP